MTIGLFVIAWLHIGVITIFYGWHIDALRERTRILEQETREKK